MRSQWTKKRTLAPVREDWIDRAKMGTLLGKKSGLESHTGAYSETEKRKQELPYRKTSSSKCSCLHGLGPLFENIIPMRQPSGRAESEISEP